MLAAHWRKEAHTINADVPAHTSIEGDERAHGARSAPLHWTQRRIMSSRLATGLLTTSICCAPVSTLLRWPLHKRRRGRPPRRLAIAWRHGCWPRPAGSSPFDTVNLRTSGPAACGPTDTGASASPVQPAHSEHFSVAYGKCSVPRQPKQRCYLGRLHAFSIRRPGAERQL